MFEDYATGMGSAYDEMYGNGTDLRTPYSRLQPSLEKMGQSELQSRVEALQSSYLDQGVTFDIGGVIGALRSIGIPTRYVSGYLHPKVDPVVGESAKGESHAWVEWWDDGWRGFDPTHDTEPGDRHVIVARGRDYNDVKPLSGIFSGSGTSRMFVDVEVTRLL